MFFKEKFSLFVDLGDLSTYSFEDLKKLTLYHFQLDIIKFQDMFTAKWEDSNTELEVNYTLEGKFIKIKSEKWKKSNCYFVRN
jgi:hypothetical protein